jgi:hypothetical protein
MPVRDGNVHGAKALSASCAFVASIFQHQGIRWAHSTLRSEIVTPSAQSDFSKIEKLNVFILKFKTLGTEFRHVTGIFKKSATFRTIRSRLASTVGVAISVTVFVTDQMAASAPLLLCSTESGARLHADVRLTRCNALDDLLHIVLELSFLRYIFYP